MHGFIMWALRILMSPVYQKKQYFLKMQKILSL